MTDENREGHGQWAVVWGEKFVKIYKFGGVGVRGWYGVSTGCGRKLGNGIGCV